MFSFLKKCHHYPCSAYLIIDGTDHIRMCCHCNSAIIQNDKGEWIKYKRKHKPLIKKEIVVK